MNKTWPSFSSFDAYSAECLLGSIRTAAKVERRRIYCDHRWAIRIDDANDDGPIWVADDGCGTTKWRHERRTWFLRKKALAVAKRWRLNGGTARLVIVGFYRVKKK